MASKLAGYSAFARYYDALTANVAYDVRAKFLASAICRYVPDAKLVLDLACGTGSLSAELVRLGFDVIGVDASAEMLSAAAQKSQDFSKPILFLNQEMDRLDLYGTVDAVVCALDSVNHVETQSKLLEVFKKAALFTNQGGVFIFDVNTGFKHREILADNVFVYDLPQVFCVWQNSYDPKTSAVEISLDFFSKSGSGRYLRESEIFSEQFYSDDILLELLNAAGFSHMETLDGDDFNPPHPKSQRLLYIAKRK